MPASQVKTPRRSSIKNKITLSIGGIILLLGIISSFLVYFLTKNILINIKKQDLIQSNSLQAQETNQAFIHSQNLVETIASQKGIISLLSNPSLTKNNLDSANNLLEQYNIAQQYSAIYLINSQGVTIASTDPSFIGKNYGFRDYFTNAVKTGSFVDVSVGVTSGKLGYYFSHSITKDNQVIGVVVIKLMPEHIHNSLIDLNHEGDIFLVDRYGTIIFSNNQKKLFKSLGMIPSNLKEEIITTKRYADKNIEALDYNLVLDGINELDKTTSYDLFDDHDKNQEILTASKIGELPFYIVSEIGTETINKFAVESALALARFVILAVILAVILTAILSAKLLKPFEEIKKIMLEISSGNLDKKLSINTRDDFEDLANIFNQMTKSLKDARQNIEDKVEKRTKDLKRLNQFMIGREIKMIELKKQLKKTS